MQTHKIVNKNDSLITTLVANHNSKIIIQMYCQMKI